ncbi:MAG: extracellular solute-binding protein [Actinobacteria bacterium]|nr:extracellular solute-binding protein [Actinomycetota bacterium]
MKRILVASLLILALMVSVAGCAKKDAGLPAQPQQPPAKVKIDVLSWWEVKPDSPLDKMKKAFEAKNPNIEINYILSPADGYYDKLLTQIAGGQVPDVAMLAQDQFMPFAEKGALMNLDKYIKPEYKSDLYPAVLKTITYKGSIYAVPRDTTANVMFYNKKLFDEAKVPYPKEGWTWDDFLAAAKALTKVDASGKPIQWGYHFATYPDGFYDWLLQNNGGFVSEDGTKSVMGSKETIEAIQFLYDLRFKYKVAPTAAQAKEFGGSSASPFQAGKVAMYSGGASRALGFTERKLDYDVAPLPKGKRAASRVFTNLWVIPKGAKNVEAAWKFLEFFGGKEGQAMAQELNIGQSALKSVDNSKFLTPPPASKKYFVEAFKDGEPFPSFSNSKEFFAMMERELDLVWNGQKKVEDGIAAIEKQAPGILSKK